MKILITGATGLVGEAIIDAALDRNYTINFLTTRKNKIINKPNLKGFYWNPKTREIDTACFEGVTAIIHLSGSKISKIWTKKNKREMYESRSLTAEFLYDTIKALNGNHKIKKFTSASAIGCYPSSSESLISEDTPLKKDTFLENIVYEWEKSVSKMESLNLTVTKLRIGLVLSSSGGILGVLRTPTFFGLGIAFGDGEQGQSWIHIDDLANLFLMTCEKNLEGIYNAVTPYPVTQTYFMRSFSKALGSPYFLPPVPAFIVRFFMGETSALVLNSHWISAVKLRDIGFKYKFEHLNDAFENLFPTSE